MAGTRLAKIGREGWCSIAVAGDLRLDGWPQKIVEAGFDLAKSSPVALEGVSMYLADDELRGTLKNIRGLCTHPGSRLWIDHVTKELLGMDLPEVRAFLASMARLGEPFVTGFADPTHFVGQGWRLNRKSVGG
jgi:O-methyltransferase involved in polyketide biosynthesis